MNPYIIGLLGILAVLFIVLNTTHKAYFLGVVGYTLLFFLGVQALAGTIQVPVTIENPDASFSYQDNQGTKGLYLVDSHTAIEKKGQTRELYLHVYKNDLTIVTGSGGGGVNCSYHLYNNTADIVSILFTNESQEYKVNVPGSYVPSRGQYNFIITCDGNAPLTENGALSSHFTVTDTGEAFNYWDDALAHTLGFILTIAGAFGFVITIFTLRSDLKGGFNG